MDDEQYEKHDRELRDMLRKSGIEDTPKMRQYVLTELVKCQQTALAMLLCGFTVDLPEPVYSHIFKNVKLMVSKNEFEAGIVAGITKVLEAAQMHVAGMNHVKVDPMVNKSTFFYVEKVGELAASLVMATIGLSEVTAPGVDVDPAVLDKIVTIVKDCMLTDDLATPSFEATVRMGAKRLVLRTRKMASETKQAKNAKE